MTDFRYIFRALALTFFPPKQSGLDKKGWTVYKPITDLNYFEYNVVVNIRNDGQNYEDKIQAPINQDFH